MTEFTFETLKTHIDQGLSWGICSEAKNILPKIQSVEEFAQLPKISSWILWYVRQYYKYFNQFKDAYPLVKLDETSTEFVESIIFNSKDPFEMIDYLRMTNKKRNAETEERLIKYSQNKELLVLYAEKIIKGRWPEAEPSIINNPDAAWQYCKQIIKRRWPKAEKSIMQSIHGCPTYAKTFLEGKWPEAETDILSRKKSNKTRKAIDFYLSIVIQKRWPEAEEVIKQYPSLCVEYARIFIKGRWPEAEEIIKTSKSASVLYATYIKGRWPEAEEIIKTSPKAAYEYARWVLETKWPEAEAIIKTSPKYWKSYCKHVSKIDYNSTYQPEYSI